MKKWTEIAFINEGKYFAMTEKLQIVEKQCKELQESLAKSEQERLSAREDHCQDRAQWKKAENVLKKKLIDLETRFGETEANLRKAEEDAKLFDDEFELHQETLQMHRELSEKYHELLKEKLGLQRLVLPLKTAISTCHDLFID